MAADTSFIRTASGIDPIEKETMRKVAWRLIPLLMVSYFAAYLDRVNVGFAALTRNSHLRGEADRCHGLPARSRSLPQSTN